MSDPFGGVKSANSKRTFRTVYNYLYDRTADNGTDRIQISNVKIMQDLGLARETVIQAIRWLEKNGFVETIPAEDEFRGRLPNTYVIHDPLSDAEQREP